MDPMGYGDDGHDGHDGYYFLYIQVPWLRHDHRART